MLHQAKNLLRNAYEWFGKNCYGIDVCFWLGPGNGQFPVPAEHQLWWERHCAFESDGIGRTAEGCV